MTEEREEMTDQVIRQLAARVSSFAQSLEDLEAEIGKLLKKQIVEVDLHELYAYFNCVISDYSEWQALRSLGACED